MKVLTTALRPVGRCGDGALEAMLEARGLRVHAIDLDVISDPEAYATLPRFCSTVTRVRPDALFNIPQPSQSAICFFWGRRAPWRAYLSAYPQVTPPPFTPFEPPLSPPEPPPEPPMSPT